MTGSEKFLKICQTKHFFEKHERVLVALSGGQDSMTLFNWLYELRDRLQIELAVAHVNHKQRPESENEEKELRALCADRDVPFTCAPFIGLFTESKARDFRYRFFKQQMTEKACTALVTAHHKEDLVETFLMRQLTGRRLRYLTGIAERQPFADGELIRPLLTFEKSELDASFYYEDSTNAENGPLRNRVRHQLIPWMTHENPQVMPALSALTDEISLALSVVKETVGPLSEAVNLHTFCQLSQALQYFTLQEYLAQFPSLQVNKAQFDTLLHIINRPQQYHHQLSDGWNFIKTAENFFVSPRESRSTLMSFQSPIILTENPNDSSFLEISLPSADYNVRSRQIGDKINFHGTHKKLKQFFIDQKIALTLRESPLIAIDSEIYAIPALRLASDLSKTNKNAKIKTIIWVK